ncbi:MAG: M48 family metallopeptidase [Polyangiales bacterium]
MLRAQLLPIALVFVLPLLTLGFIGHVLNRYDADFIAGAVAHFERAPDLSPDQRALAADFVRAHPPSEVCVSGDPELARYRAQVSNFCEATWQFTLARSVARWTLALGVFATLLGAGLALLARYRPSAQYASFVFGWRAMQVFAAVETVAQGAMLVWLSFWLTAYFFHFYAVKIIAVAAVLALSAAVVVIKAIFVAPLPPPTFDAVRVPEERAAGLFARVRELCARVGTEAPTNLLAGVDDNFFVTESPLPIVDGVVEGRTLYVSLALLRVLDREETDAVLAHEMGHFVGGDTAFTLRMAPKLAASTRYLIALRESLAPVFYVMSAYFAVFDLALRHTEREREFAADALAARVVSGEALTRALVKTAAYANYRTRVEAKLFEHDRAHDALGIAARVAEGFAEYAAGEDFAKDMQGTATPHPFDSHPPLAARMEAVGAPIAEGELSAVALTAPTETWLGEIADAESIEARLWSDYEARFQTAHERSLAFRYLPSTAEEEAVVERHFPVRTFAYEYDTVTLDHRTLTTPAWGSLSLDDVRGMQLNERMFKKYLDLQTVDGRQHSLVTKGFGSDLQPFLDALALYVGRQQMAREYAQRRDRESEGEVTTAA